MLWGSFTPSIRGKIGQVLWVKGKVVEEGVKHMFSAIVFNSDQGSSLRLAILLLCIGHSFLSMVTARAVSIKAWFGRKCSRFVLKSQHGSTHSGILGLSSTKSIHYTVFPGSLSPFPRFRVWVLSLLRESRCELPYWSYSSGFPRSQFSLSIYFTDKSS